MQYDETDLKILALYLKDGRRSFGDIAKIIHVSPGTVHVRVKKMEKLGIIKGTTIQIDYEKLGYDITAFLGIYLDKSSLYEEVSEAMKTIPEIVAAHYTTGNYSIFAKIVCRDTNHLREVLHDKLQKIAGIQRTETFISLEESIDRPLSLIELEGE